MSSRGRATASDRPAHLETGPKCIPERGNSPIAARRAEQVSDGQFPLARQLFERVRQPNRQRRLDRDWLASVWPGKGDRRGMQEVPFELDRLFAPPVDTIAHDRMPDERQMHADLVRAPGLWEHFEQAEIGVLLDHAELGDRLAPL